MEAPRDADDSEEVLRIDTELGGDVTVTDGRGQPCAICARKISSSEMGRRAVSFSTSSGGVVYADGGGGLRGGVSGSMTAEEMLRLGGEMRAFTNTSPSAKRSLQ